MSLKKEMVDMESILNKSEAAYLYVAKNYINHLDLRHFDDVTYNITNVCNELEDDFMNAHHQIISDMLRRINNDIFKGNSEHTLLWMEKELNNHTWEAFNSMTF